MKWACRSRRQNAGFWAAIIVATLSPTWAASSHHPHHWGAWVTGLLIGLVGTLAVGLAVLRARRCL